MPTLLILNVDLFSSLSRYTLPRAPSELPVNMPSIAQQATEFCLPDIISHCPIPASLNPHHKQACSEADQWFISGAALTEKTRKTFLSQLCTLFPAMCFPHAAYTEMRVICDCLSWFFLIDDISDEMSSLGTVQVAADVMNVLWHTDTYEPRGLIARMCREYVRCFMLHSSVDSLNIYAAFGAE